MGGRRVEREIHLPSKMTTRDAAEVALDLGIIVASNVLDAVDQGKSTKELRKSLKRAECGTADPGKDTLFFALSAFKRPTKGIMIPLTPPKSPEPLLCLKILL